VMRVRYEELVADQARGARPAGVPRRAVACAQGRREQACFARGPPSDALGRSLRCAPVLPAARSQAPACRPRARPRAQAPDRGAWRGRAGAGEPAAAEACGAALGGARNGFPRHAAHRADRQPGSGMLPEPDPYLLALCWRCRAPAACVPRQACAQFGPAAPGLARIVPGVSGAPTSR